jgi:hypothetical protein
MEDEGKSRSIDEAAAHTTDEIESRIRQAVHGYAFALLPLIPESYGTDSVQEAWREFMFDDDALFNGDDTHAELFFSWFFHCWSPTPKKGNKVVDPGVYGVAPTQTYLARHSSHLDPLLQRYLEACLKTPLGFYEVAEHRPNIGFRAQNVLTGATIDVIENLASTSLENGHIVLARIPFIHGMHMVDAISPVSFPSSFRMRLSQFHVDPDSRECSDLVLLDSYFDLLESFPGEWLPESRR